MAGLLTQAQQAAPQMGAQPAEGDAPSPEEQEWYDGVQKAAGEILFKNEKSSAQVVQMIDPNNPAESAGIAAAMVLIQVDRGMDGEIPETVILPAAEEILDHVLDIAEAAKALERSPELEEEAARAMVERLTEEYGVDEADFNEAQTRVGAVK